MSAFAKIFSVILLIPALFGQYKTDAKDTEAAYLERIAAVGYENTVETAIPMTELHDMVVDHFNAPLPEGKTEKKAIIIGYDGCRADVVSLAKAETAGIRRIVDNGGSISLGYCGGVNYPDGENTQDTSTAPGWCAVLTGVWADKNGVYTNGQPKNMEYKTLMTTLTEDGTIDSAAFLTKWSGHFSKSSSTYLPEKQYCEENGLNVSFKKCSGNNATANATVKLLSGEDCPDFTITIYEGTDGAGHDYGFSFNNPLYQSGFEKCEKLAAKTLDTIEGRASYEAEDWLIIITSDHGGYGTGHGGATIQERMVFIVTNK